MQKHSVPVIDIAPLLAQSAQQTEVAHAIRKACQTHGFFYISGHGVSEQLQQELEEVSAQFFDLEEAAKQKISMEKGGRAWRGYFPLGGELTSGKPDLKAGLYLGSELGPDDPRVQAGRPMHGANLFPAEIPEFRRIVLSYMDALTNLGHDLMRGIAMSLGLDEGYFQARYTADPLTLFRIFYYPSSEEVEDQWGVGEHTDYGVLTILKQDSVGGLQIKSSDKWIDAPYVPGTFVCNIGDMLDRMTGGLYRSTPHRVLNTSGKDRYSFPFFFDPNVDAEIAAIELPDIVLPEDDQHQRWDGASVHQFSGTYGDYILTKVGKVFPDLKKGIQ
ncbi:MAG: 2-oxoglutarate and iron-dependent oxygenase domain-containing protein [Bacteroidota bacterium]